MGAWRRFRLLEGRDRRVVAEAAVLLLLVRAGLSVLPFSALRRGLRHYTGPQRQTPVNADALVRRVAWAVTAVARRLPIRTTCLVESLAADAMLRRRGCACDLRFGVQLPRTASGGLAAHAWIEHRGVVVLGDVPGLPEYAVLSGLAGPAEAGPRQTGDARASLFGLLGGEEVRWPQIHATATDFLAACAEHEVKGLARSRLERLAHREEWPPEIHEDLAAYAHREAALEMLRGAEISRVLADLAAAGIQPVLIKGTSLAYGIYEAPMCRPRADTDMLVRECDVEAAREVFARRGYAATVHCSDLFSQFEVQKVDRFDVVHVFDVHWKISTQPAFENLFAYDELLVRSLPVPALGPNARGAGAVDALLLACVHPVMHHQNIERVLWIYDVHLLASTLARAGFEELTRLARQKRVAAICAHSLRLAETAFHCAIPAGVVEALSAGQAPEPSAEYLVTGRRWHHELISSMRGASSFGRRARILREVLFPSPQYMLGAYGFGDKPLGALLLPALYVYRNVNGAWKIVSGKK